MRTRIKNKKNKIIVSYLQNNIKEIITISIIFIIGIVLGIMLINNTKQEGKEEIQNYINQFITNLKQENSLDKAHTLINSIKKDVTLGIIVWIVGSTVIGIPIVYGIIAYRGFCFGYTIAAIIAVLGTKSGTLISVMGLVIQNLIFIPSIILIAASSMKLYKTIIKNKKRENIKLEICKHSIISAFAIGGIIISSFAKVLISTNLLIFFAKYI